MSVLSTTNPLPPDGSTNASAPLGITSSFSTSQTPYTTKVDISDTLSFQPEILIGSFTVSNTQAIGTKLFTWNTQKTGLSQYLFPYSQTVKAFAGKTAWSLVQPGYARMTKMNYKIILKPYKVADAAVYLHAIWNYDNRATSNYDMGFTANQGEIFQFNDSSEIKELTVPQFWPLNNLINENSLYSSASALPNAHLPYTQLNIFLANKYHNNLVIPDSFTVQVFLVPIPVLSQVPAGRRVNFSSFSTTPVNAFNVPYFMTDV